VSVTLGTSTAAGALVKLTFQTAYKVAPDAVTVSANDAATAALNPFASVTATQLTIGVDTAGTAADTYVFNYVVVGGA
jgi:hypothetical protein